MKKIAMLALAALIATAATAEVRTKVVEYRDGDVVLEGYLAWDDALKGPRPGVLVVHQWMGVSANERMRAEQLAALGYVALAADVYGKGVRPANMEEASSLSGKWKGDRARLRVRVAAGLAELKRQPRSIHAGSRRSATVSAAPRRSSWRSGAGRGRGDVPRRPRLADPGGRPEHPGKATRAARRRRPDRPHRRHRRVSAGAARRRR
jgi:hypothetical protein